MLRHEICEDQRDFGNPVVGLDEDDRSSSHDPNNMKCSTKARDRRPG